MSQTITLYVDGACRGNPGLGGWGAYVITETQKHELCGGAENTTNNRMELQAAIEGIKFCAPSDKLIIWTDSTYVKRGITEWITNWKKKNWKDVKNPDLWKELDAVCQNREIEWNWIKGHAGHAGNEKADQLANLGADKTQAQLRHAASAKSTDVSATTELSPTSAALAEQQAKKKDEPDWLLDDPFGFDLLEADDSAFDEPTADQQDESTADPQLADTDAVSEAVQTPELSATLAATTHPHPNAVEHMTDMHPEIKITPATRDEQGPRQFILDTETTGFYFQDTDRIVEVGAIEMINRKLTGRSIHIYINPEKPVGDSADIHGITDEFLKDKPKYAEIATVLFDYLKGAEIIAHNASFDMNFLNMEFKRCGLPALSDVCSVTDTLAMAKAKHPGQKNSLDALVRRYEIPQRDRTFHGALLDAEILSDVYLAMTGGQVSFDMDAPAQTEQQRLDNNSHTLDLQLPVILPSAEELAAHEQWMAQFAEKNGEACLFAQTEVSA